MCFCQLGKTFFSLPHVRRNYYVDKKTFNDEKILKSHQRLLWSGINDANSQERRIVIQYTNDFPINLMD